MRGLNLKGFTKIASDEHTSTFRHPDGHEIKVATKALHPSLRADLQAMPLAKGGKVARYDEGTGDGGVSTEDEAPAPKAARPAMKVIGVDKPPKPVKSEPQDSAYWSRGPYVPAPKEPNPTPNYADGGNVVLQQSRKKMADGGDPGADKQAPVVINVGGTEQHGGGQDLPLPPVPEAAQPGAMPAPPQAAPEQGFSVGQMGQDAMNAVNPMVQGAQAAPDSAGQNIQMPEQEVASQAPQPTYPSQQPQEAPRMPAQAQAPASDPYGMGSMAEGLNKGYGEELAGVYGTAEAAQKAGELRAQAAHAEAQRQQEIMDQVGQRQNGLALEQDQAVQDYRAGHIDPNRYMAEMGTGNKIKTAIGLILGGMGGGMTHQGNPALAFLEHQIDRDIDAQKANLGKQHNLVSIYSQQLGDSRQGAIMANSVAKSIAAAQFDEAGAKAMTPQAKATALMAAGKLRRDIAMNNQSLAMRQTMMGLANDAGKNPDRIGQMIGFMRMTNPEMAKEYESRYIPGIGLAQIPLSEDSRKQAIAMQDFHNQMGNLMSWAQKHSGETKFTNPTDVNIGHAMALAAQNSYRTAQGMGVYKPSEIPLLEGEVPQDPTAFFNKYRIIPQYKAVMQNNDRKMDTFMKSYGINRPQIQESAPVKR